MAPWALVKSDGIEDDDGDLSVNLGLVAGEPGVGLLPLRPDRLSFVSTSGPGSEAPCFSADLCGDVGVRHQVVEPAGMSRGTGFGSEDGDSAVAKVLAHHRADSFLTAVGADSVQE
jgi:hypothetical protein